MLFLYTMQEPSMSVCNAIPQKRYPVVVPGMLVGVNFAPEYWRGRAS
jgi:hypothetical protein